MNTKNLISEKLKNVVTLRMTLIYIISLIILFILLLFINSTIIILIFYIETICAFTAIKIVPNICKNCSCRIEQDGIIIKKDFIFSKTSFIGFENIEYCIMIIFPIDKLYGLCSIIILSGGSHEIIHGLTEKNGELISNEVRKVSYENKVI